MGALGLIETALAVTMSSSRIVSRMRLPKSGQEGLVEEGRQLTLQKLKTARKLENEHIWLFVNMICNSFGEIIVSSSAVH